MKDHSQRMRRIRFGFVRFGNEEEPKNLFNLSIKKELSSEDNQEKKKIANRRIDGSECRETPTVCLNLASFLEGHICSRKGLDPHWLAVYLNKLLSIVVRSLPIAYIYIYIYQR